MKHIAIFADVSNLYYCIGMKYPDRKLDYAAYYEYISDLGLIDKAIAYGAQLDNEAEGFIHCLRSAGFEPKYKTPKTYRSDGKIKRKADWDVGIAIDMVNFAATIDLMVLGSADGDLCPVVEWVQNRSVQVIILACGISRDLRDLATKAIEIPQSLLEKKNDRFIQQQVSNSGQRSESIT